MRWTSEELADYMRRQGGGRESLLQAEAERVGRQGLADDKTESMIQQEGVRQARLLMQANGYDPRLLFSIPNGAHIRNAEVQGGRLVGEGLVAGVPDLFLAVQRQNISPEGQHWLSGGLWIEVKRPGQWLRKEQDEIMTLLISQGFNGVVCHSPQEIVEHVISYLGITPSGDRSGPTG